MTKFRWICYIQQYDFFLRYILEMVCIWKVLGLFSILYINGIVSIGMLNTPVRVSQIFIKVVSHFSCWLFKLSMLWLWAFKMKPVFILGLSKSSTLKNIFLDVLFTCRITNKIVNLHVNQIYICYKCIKALTFGYAISSELYFEV